MIERRAVDVINAQLNRGVLFAGYGWRRAPHENGVEVAHDCGSGLVDERQPYGHDASIGFGRGVASIQPFINQVQRVVGAYRLMETHFVVTEGRDDGVIGEPVDELLLESEHVQARGGEPAGNGLRNRLVDVDRERVPALGERHHLVAVNG